MEYIIFQKPEPKVKVARKPRRPSRPAGGLIAVWTDASLVRAPERPTIEVRCSVERLPDYEEAPECTFWDSSCAAYVAPWFDPLEAAFK